MSKNEAKKQNTTIQEVPKTTAATAKTRNFITVDEAIIKQVSSPYTIQRIAIDRAISPQEVYVRVTFEHKGDEFAVSNKLKFLTKAGYEELLKAKNEKTPLRLVVDTESGFFYVKKDVNIDDLFKEEVTKPADNRKNLAELLLNKEQL